jgi:hypothetical protein
MNRSTRKTRQKSAQNLQRPAPGTKSGFRKLMVDGVPFLWKVGRKFVEIRTPLPNLKYIVPRYRVSGFASEAEMRAAHDRLDCCHSGCCDTCAFGGISPREVRDYVNYLWLDRTAHTRTAQSLTPL